MFLMETGLPFDDVRRLIHQLPPCDHHSKAMAIQHNGLLFKPQGSLGRLEELAIWLASWQRTPKPKIINPLVAIFASGHGVATHPVHYHDSRSDVQKLDSFQKGYGVLNQLSRHANASLRIFEMGIDIPTGDITVEAAFSEKDCVATMAYGMESVAEGGDLLCLGEIGQAGSLVAATVCSALFGDQDWLDESTFATPQDYQAAQTFVKKAVETHQQALGDPLEILRRLGGRDIAAMVGAIMAARYQNIPVLLDGFISATAAAILFNIDAHAIDHCLAAHVSTRSSHKRLLNKLAKIPLLDLGIDLEEGCGAALAIPLLRAATVCHSGTGTLGHGHDQNHQ
jgi:nicotinate-nucleotide--dimethylbenzimidazole phosphoribosyltransferase